MLLSIVTPAYNEENNLALFRERLAVALKQMDCEWEWVIVDDHSRDRTFDSIKQIAAGDERIKGLRLSRNSGSHVSITCGLHVAKGDCVVAMASDLQDPPETIPQLVAKWRTGAQVVWAVRESREDGSVFGLWFGRLYYWIMRHISGMSEMPATGADFFLVDRTVLEALKRFKETNVSMFALLTWMGFRQDRIAYIKEARAHGRSGWTFKKKMKLVADSITSFTYLPIRLMSYLGVGVAVTGFVYALYVVINALVGTPAPGWSSLIVVVLVVGGIQMMMMGVLGEYVWRALDETRRRPRYLVEQTTELKSADFKDLV